ncbi:MAG: efflux RND transporter periplasmic adaptor subunit [Ruminococcus sp.]|nr:efflux RND transporter periplasmic adaptor subunit [Ruminococcus sp.]
MRKAIAIILCAVMAAAVSGCSEKEKTEQIAVPIYEAKTVSYKTAKAEVSEISERYVAEGNYSYPYSESVKFSASGQVDQVYVVSEQLVKKGDLLCTLFSDSLDDQIEEKEVYLNQAQKTLNTLILNGGNYNEIEQAKVELEIQQLEYDHLLEQKEQYSVYAPCDGHFKMDRRFGGGLTRFTWVNNGTVLGYATDESEQFLTCSIYDSALKNVNFGTRVGLTQGAHSAEGMVVDIIHNENGDYTTYTYVIRPDEDSELFDFGSVQVSFNVYSRQDTVVVPNKAVKKVGDRQFVNLLVDGVKIEQDVETGIVDGDRTEIIGGLIGGEELILN